MLSGREGGKGGREEGRKANGKEWKGVEKGGGGGRREGKGREGKRRDEKGREGKRRGFQVFRKSWIESHGEW
jgi:hypothetical protein